MSETLPVLPSPQSGGAVVSQEQLARWQEDAGQGVEHIEATDVAIPFLGHVQAQSKQLVDGHPKYLPDAKVGTIFNTVTGECFAPKEGVQVVVIDITKVVAEKEPKDAGGQFVKVYATRAEAQAEASPDNELVDGFRVFVLYLTKGGTWAPAVISMCTKSKVYTMRNWNALLTGLRVPGPNGTKIQPPTFAWVYKLTSALLEFDDGAAAVLTAAAVGPTEDVVYALAKKFRKALSLGSVKLGKDGETATDAEQDGGDDLPF